MDELYFKHYIRLRSDGCIVDGWSDGPHNERTPTEDDLLLTGRGGYQFRLVIDGQPTEENPELVDFDFRVPYYRWTGSEAVRRTEEELAAEFARKRAEAEAAERERVDNAPETILLEMTADHEERLCMLELFGGGEV